MALVRTRRWSDPSDPDDPDDGLRLLITRFRPRGVRKTEEPWDRWEKRLAPGLELFDAFWGRRREGRKVVASGLPSIGFAAFKKRFLTELKSPDAKAALAEIRERVARGETTTLLCFCEDASQCHRTIVESLLTRD